MVAAQQPLPVSGQETQERGDAARNRELLLAAARKLIAERGPDAVTMDDIAAEAGVGKGTLFRRFGNRAGLSPRLCPAGGVKGFGRRFPRRPAKSEDGAYVRVEEGIACRATACGDR